MAQGTEQLLRDFKDNAAEMTGAQVRGATPAIFARPGRDEDTPLEKKIEKTILNLSVDSDEVSVAGYRASAAAQTRAAASGTKDEKKKRESDTRFFLSDALRKLYEEQGQLLEEWRDEKENNERLKQEIAETEQRMAELEERLAKDEDGNIDWGKEAEAVLGKEATAKLPGETDAQHEQRMQQLLRAEMLDADGNIKEKYIKSDAGLWLAAQQKLVQLKRDLGTSNQKLDDLAKRIVQNAQKIEEQEKLQREPLAALSLKNEEFLTKLNRLSGGETSREARQAALTQLLNERSDLAVKFDLHDTDEQRIEKVQRAVQDNQVEVDRALVEIEERREASKKAVEDAGVNRAALQTQTATTDLNIEKIAVKGAGVKGALTMTFSLTNSAPESQVTPEPSSELTKQPTLPAVTPGAGLG